MRFAYIDSQGKEVGIPSVEALQLRIELGAITEETIFYDASKDRWDPAGDHEIFRTLSREIRERGQGGPRPPTPKVENRPSDGEEEEGTPKRAVDPFAQEQDPLGDTAEPGEIGWVEAELEELTEATEDGDTGGPQQETDEGGDWDVDLAELGSLDLAPGLEESSEAGNPGAPSEPIGLGSTSDVAGGAAAEGTEDTVDSEAEADVEDRVAKVAGDVEFEGAWSERSVEDAGVFDDSPMDLEKPLSEQDPGSSPPDEGRGGSVADNLDFSGTMEVEEPEERSVPATEGSGGWQPGEAPGATAEEDRVEGEEAGGRAQTGPIGRRDPYDRRVRPPRAQDRGRRARAVPRRRGRRSGALVAAALVVLATGGTWIAWSVLGGEEEATAETEEALVAIPDLPSELEPAMRMVADSAYADMLDSLRAMATAFALASEPNTDWLAGVYLANARGYQDVPTYWDAIRSYADSVRAADETMFMETLGARLAEADIAPDARDTVFARVRAGFRAAAPDRREVYDDVEDLVDAATGLHEFLVANQSNIDYEPAASLSRDPVTEAIPSTQALGEEMWERVGRIPAALDALGTLDRVTTERILDVVFRRLEAVGVR